MSLSHLHEFHFVLDRSMKKNLMGLKLYQKLGNLSGVITRILSLISPVIKREHKWGEQRKSRYLPVCNDPEEIREHMHVYFPEKVYREFKLMHQDLNYYSIAQLVREFLRYFLDLVQEYKDKTLDELQRLFRQWKKENKRINLTPRKIIRQLWKIIQHLPDQTGLINIYCKDFSPFWIFRL